MPTISPLSVLSLDYVTSTAETLVKLAMKESAPEHRQTKLRDDSKNNWHKD